MQNSENSNHACAKVIGRWWEPEDVEFTRYSQNKVGDTRSELWANKLLGKITDSGGCWNGKVKDYAIYACKNKERIGNPIYKNVF